MEKIVARSLFDGLQSEMSDSACVKDFGKSMTLQSEADDADINNIVRDWTQKGRLPELIKAQPQYGDFSSVPDLQEAKMILQRSEAQFYALDAKVRAKFDNSVDKFLGFVNAHKGDDLLLVKELGLSESINVNVPVDVLAPKDKAPQGAASVAAETKEAAPTN